MALNIYIFCVYEIFNNKKRTQKLSQIFFIKQIHPAHRHLVTLLSRLKFHLLRPHN